MENQQSQQPLFNTQPIPLPNATAVLVLGIVGIVGCFCYGIPGLICSIIAMVLAKKDIALYKSNPGYYSEASYNNLKAGRICAIIGLSLSILCVVTTIIYICFVGTYFLSHPGMFNQLKH